MKILAIAFILFQCLLSLAQPPALEHYFSYEIESLLAHDSLRNSQASHHYARIGDYLNAMRLSDSPISWGIDTLDLEAYQLQPALESIVEEVKDKRIVIISESHSRPQHRIFSKQLIDKLADHGFETLYMEALSNYKDSTGQWVMWDQELQSRGFALNNGFTGFYTLEPQMANLVRKALSRGYHVKAYESIGREKGSERDVVQTENIINQWNGEKIIIHCGYWHAIETDKVKKGKSFWMAKLLKDSTGIDPITIYQDHFTEKVRYDQHPILSKIHAEVPSVFTKEGEIVKLSDHFDIEVVHPLTVYKNGRPDWLYEQGKHVSYEIDLTDSDLDFPVFIKAYYPNEIQMGVPVDIIEVKHKYDNKTLVLPTGSYTIILANKFKEERKTIEVH